MFAVGSLFLSVAGGGVAFLNKVVELQNDARVCTALQAGVNVTRLELTRSLFKYGLIEAKVSFSEGDTLDSVQHGCGGWWMKQLDSAIPSHACIAQSVRKSVAAGMAVPESLNSEAVEEKNVCR